MPQLARSPRQIGAFIRHRRQLLGMSQAGLGELAGLRQATISQIEAGSAATRIGTLLDILAVLNLELEVVARSGISADALESLF